MPWDTTFTSILFALIGRSAPQQERGGYGDEDAGDPAALSAALLSSRGEASGRALADRLLRRLEAADDAGLAAYFAVLRDRFEIDNGKVAAAAERARDRSSDALAALQRLAEPPRQELLRRLNAAPGGTARLVRLRAKLLAALRSDPTLAPVDADLRHLLRSWFNRGFLLPARIDWNTSADILEKIIAYEAVHAIDSWEDLRQRLVPGDRRCFAFFHPAMPNEPLIFVEVALTKDIAVSIDAILAPHRKTISPDKADTAIFYSISNCQKGLAGISFGAFLIKQVASDLAADLPNLRRFATLSPVPGFAAWLETACTGVPPAAEEDKVALCARYLTEARAADGRPLDPVARFHLGNGAVLQQINARADRSAKGLAQSHGLMVNYLYELDRVEARHEAFALRGEIATSRAVRGLARKSAPSAAAPFAAKVAS